MAVITKDLNDKLFGGNSVGKSIRLNQNEFRIIGVTDKWRPTPRFFDLTQRPLRRMRTGLHPLLHFACAEPGTQRQHDLLGR